MEKREDINYDDEIDLFELFERLYKEKWLIIVITSVITVLTAIVSLSLPKVYKATMYFELSRITVSELQELRELLVKNNRFKFRIDIGTIPNSSTNKIEVEGKSPEDAKNNLLEVINHLNELNMIKIQLIKEDLTDRLNSINRVLLELSRRNNIIYDYDPKKDVEILVQKQKIEKWLQKSELIILSSKIFVTSEPVRPKPLLYTMIGFVTGLFLAIFIALIRDFIINRKK